MRPVIVVMTEGARSFARRKLRDVPGALEAAESLLAHTLSVATVAGDVEVCAPAGSDAIDLARSLGLPWIEQVPGTLGARVGAALAAAADPGRPILLLGDDCPGLTAEQLLDATKTLRSGARSVVGPAPDGGFWLLGLASWCCTERLAVSIASRVKWSTAGAAASLEALLCEELGAEPAEAFEQCDLDRVEDLPRAAVSAATIALRDRLESVRLAPALPLPDEAFEPLPELTPSDPELPRPPPRR